MGTHLKLSAGLRHQPHPPSRNNHNCLIQASYHTSCSSSVAAIAALSSRNQKRLHISSGSMVTSHPMTQLYLNPLIAFHNVSDTSSFLVDIPSECPKYIAYMYIPLLKSNYALEIPPFMLHISFWSTLAEVSVQAFPFCWTRLPNLVQFL